ncbi:hypothetical protein ACOME3_003255 [Neoechinorhynchus agilis]
MSVCLVIIVLFTSVSYQTSSNGICGNASLALSIDLVKKLSNISQMLTTKLNHYDAIQFRSLSVKINDNLRLKLSSQVKERYNFLRQKGYNFRIVWYILSFGSQNFTIQRAIAHDRNIDQYKSFVSWIHTNKEGELIVLNVQPNISEIYFAVGVELQGTGFTQLIKRYYIKVFQHMIIGICGGGTVFPVPVDSLTIDLYCGIIYCYKENYILDDYFESSPIVDGYISSTKNFDLDNYYIPSTVFAPIQCQTHSTLAIARNSELKRDDIVNCLFHFPEKVYYSRDVKMRSFLLVK